MSPCGRVPFSNKDDHFLAMYIAKYNPDTKGRNGNGIYKRLVENAEGRWPWARHHPWQSWRERYIKENLFIDKLVRKYIRENGGDLPDAHASTSQPSHHVKTSQSSRTEFSHEDDEHLIKYIARYNPLLSGRSGNVLYQTLEANTEQKWAWSTRHPWKSWRERYVNKKEYFDMRILKYQEEKGVRSYLDKDEVKGKEKHGDSDENEETPTAKSSGRPQQEKRKRPSTEEDVESRKGKRRRVGDPVPGKGHKVVEILSDEAGDDTRGSTKESHQGGRQDNGKEDTTHDAGRHISRGNKDDVIEHTGGDAIGRDGAQTKKPRPGPTVVDQEEDGEVRLPGSDDYCGEIFDREDSQSDSEEEQEADELLEEASMDSSERDAMQVVEEVTPKKNEDITPLSYSPSPSLTPPIPNHADIDIRLPSSVAAGKPTPPTYPASSTGTRLQGRPSPSQAVPSSGASPFEVSSAQAEADMRADGIYSASAEQVAGGADATAKRGRGIVVEAPEMRQPRTEPDTSSTALASTPPSRKRKRPLRKDDDIFATPTNEDASPLPKQPRKVPVRLEQGAYNSAFTDVQGRHRVSPDGRRKRVLGIDEEDVSDNATTSQIKNKDEAWPPIRGTASGKGEERVMASGRKGKGKETTVTTERFVSSVKKVTTVEREAPIPTNPILVRASMSPTKQARLSSLFTPSAAKVASLSQSQQEPDDFAISPLPSAVAGSRRTVPLSSTDRSRIDRVLRENAHLLPSTKRGASASLLRSAILQARSTPKNRSTIFEIHPISNANASPPLEVEDVSRMPSSTKTDVGKGKGKEVIFPSPSESGWSHRRHTMGYTAVENQFMNESFGGGSIVRRAPRASLPGSLSIRSGAEYSRRRSLRRTSIAPSTIPISDASSFAADVSSQALSVPLPSSELELVTDYGVQCVIAGMVENHGFNAETVRKVCANARSLRLADHVLCRMRESANECADEVLQSLQQEEEEEEDDDDEGHSTLLLSHVDRVHPRYGQAFEYSPIPGSPRTDESIAADTDFVPPKNTRAGQFVRLVREGRADEARRRESLRASGAGLSSPLESDLGSDDEDVFVEQSLLADVETNTSDTPFFGTGDTPDLVPLARSRNLKGLRQLENTMGRGSVKILTGRLVDQILARHKV